MESRRYDGDGAASPERFFATKTHAIQAGDAELSRPEIESVRIRKVDTTREAELRRRSKRKRKAQKHARRRNR